VALDKNQRFCQYFNCPVEEPEKSMKIRLMGLKAVEYGLPLHKFTATETELKIMTAALPVVEAVPASQDSCWPGDGPAHDDDCTETDHAASTAAVAATEGLSWEFSTWTTTAAWFRAAIEIDEMIAERAEVR
jgi:hypothetical protein